MTDTGNFLEVAKMHKNVSSSFIVYLSIALDGAISPPYEESES